MLKSHKLSWEEVDAPMATVIWRANVDPYRYEVCKTNDGAELRILRRDNLGGVIAYQDFSVFARDVSAAQRLAAGFHRLLYKARHYNAPVTL
jgi:hypothetical protein